MTHCERLSVLDAAFLDAETAAAPLHVGAVAIFDAGPVGNGNGAVDFEWLRAYIGAAVASTPRYRQKVVRTPVLGHPVWVDDDRFVLDFHVRHTRLPAPGDDEQLARLAGRIFSQRLDRDHPLWEIWVVEGLDQRRFALIAKLHHCMIDGVAGAGLLAQLLRGTPDTAAPPARDPGPPRPAPDGLELLAREVLHRVRGLGEARRLLRGVHGSARGSIARWLRRAPKTPFNPPTVGPHRRVDWTRFDLADLKELERRLGGTVNDVALAIVAGALRRATARRGLDPAALHHVRAMVPVSLRAGDDGALGNRVAVLLPELPVDVADPRERLARVVDTMAELKRGHDVADTHALEELADATGAPLIGALFRVGARFRPFNLVVTNVPGPPFPLYLLGARMRAIYPYVPLVDSQAVAVALFSYAGTMFVGLVADWHQVPDLQDLVGDLEDEYAALAELAGLETRAQELSMN